jgi:hypothetical protein
LVVVNSLPSVVAPLTVGVTVFVGGDTGSGSGSDTGGLGSGSGSGSDTGAGVTATLRSTVAVCPSESVTTRRTYFVPAPKNVNDRVDPLPSGHNGGIGRVVPPSSDHS